MHYYRPINTPIPVKPYNNLTVTVPNDMFSINEALNYLRANCTKVVYTSKATFRILTIRTPSEIQSAIPGAIVEYL